MNGISRLNRDRNAVEEIPRSAHGATWGNGGDGHNAGDPEDLDPGLLGLFDAASEQTPLSAPEHFVATTLLRMRHAARARLISRCAIIIIIMTLSALAAPNVAAMTLDAMSWMTDHLVMTGMALTSPLGSLCAALLAWLVARRTKGSPGKLLN